MRAGRFSLLWLPIVSLLFASRIGLAQEQTRSQSDESSEGIRQVIENYIKKDAEIKGGFLLPDSQAGKLLNLTFGELHKNVEYTEEGSPFVCVDFKDEQGKKYDVDLHVRKTNDEWNVSTIVIHKVDGKERPQPAKK